MRAIWLAVSALVALGGTAEAQRFSNLTGGKLGDLCISRDRNVAESCTAYLDGISDATSFYQWLMPAGRLAWRQAPGLRLRPRPDDGPAAAGKTTCAGCAAIRRHKSSQRPRRRCGR